MFFVVLLAYVGGAQLSVTGFGASELGPAFFPPAGVTVAALLLTRRAQWPVVIAAVILGESAVDLYAGYELSAIAGYVLANSVEPLVGASVVLALCNGVPDLRHRKDLFLFVAGACLVGPLVGGLIGGATVAAHFGVWWPGAALRWFASDAIGALVVAAPILLWRKQFPILQQRPVEACGILGTTAALSWLAIWTGLSPSLLILPALAWAALRLDVLGAALAGAAAAFSANLRAASGLTLFDGVDLSPSGRMALIQILIAVNVLLAMMIAQEGAARREAARGRAVEQQQRQRLQTVAEVLHSAAHPAALAAVAGVDYSAVYKPAEGTGSLGGDWYSVLPLRNDRIYLAVGDVVGHGLAAVEDMVQLRSAGNAYAYQGLGPGRILDELNQFAGGLSQAEFATTLVMVFDPPSGMLTYSSAGHPPALLRRAQTGEVIRLGEANGSVIGPFCGFTYEEATVSVAPDDVVVMYSDGLVEGADRGVDAGIAELEHVVASWSPDALLDCEALAAEVASTPLGDDVCVLVVRVQAPNPPLPSLC
ncbi:SpoIIE family protein phosphatase [Mycolicibacterium sp.]|uniref:SpoIIE family protein phosphatase n=1 Tax=Mycolicibacterium sp. TaxID=2320850 RepID=UPI0028AF9CD6|nr:SpoIIE family protein phosphatase [Mycolicibacterium sp.]